MRINVDELVFFDNPRVAGDTFIFEPAGGEKSLGMLLAAAETEDREGAGRELIETIIGAIQREYYRDPRRGVLASFESALHQANLVLHEVVEQGSREWMGSLHVSLGVISNRTLHVSSGGNGRILLVRQRRVVSLTDNLSHSPITNPLRTFSQVASGTVSEKDVLYFGTSQAEQVFRREDLASFAINNSAAGISLRLRQLYEDQGKRLPLAILVVALASDEVAALAQETDVPYTRRQREPVIASAHLRPKKPLEINHSLLKRLAWLTVRVIAYTGRAIRSYWWPLVVRGSQQSGRALYKASRSAGHNMRSLTSNGLLGTQRLPTEMSSKAIRYWSRRLWTGTRRAVSGLPTSSKVFAVLAIMLAAALVVSLVMMQKKRASDFQVQQASELLHEARTKKEAAATALIYDNREQARNLLSDAERLAEKLKNTALYQEQTNTLVREIMSVQDRLDKVTRVRSEDSQLVGNFASVMTNTAPSQLLWLQGSLYSYDHTNNTIAKMTTDGAVEVVNQTTQGIGFFTTATAHQADKSLVLATDSPGIALFDTKAGVLQSQEISLPSNDPEIQSLATYGNRIYLYDKSASNIYGYSKTLRGYSGGNAWITNKEFPRNNITDIGVDGYIYTLHQDGTISKLLKGTPVDFQLGRVQPAISGSAKLIIDENLRHLYVFDPPNKRVIIFDTVGNLNRQIYLGDSSRAQSVAVSADETKLYILDSTEVFEISLLQQQEEKEE